MSVSSEWREKGNALLKQDSPNAAFPQRLELLEQALACYVKARQHSDGLQELAMACKNIGATNRRLAKLHYTKSDAKDAGEISQTYSKEAISSYKKALKHGSDMPDSWKKQTLSYLVESFKEAVDVLPVTSHKERIDLMGDYLEEMPDCTEKGEGYLLMTTAMFSIGTTDYKMGRYKQCMGHMKDCVYPMEQAKTLSKGTSNVMEEVRVLEKDVAAYQRLAEAMLAKQQGDHRYSAASNSSPVNAEKAFEAIDWYKEAASLFKDADVEMEANCISMIGRVHQILLKDDYKALQNHLKAVTLVKVVQPETYKSKEWYQESLKFLTEMKGRLALLIREIDSAIR